MRFIKLVGKLAKFATLSQNARETGPMFHVLATTRKSNTVHTPGHIDSYEFPQTIVLCRSSHCAFPAEFLQEVGQVGLAVR